jgi:hypothetical protein
MKKNAGMIRGSLTNERQSGHAVQAGTLMTATGNGTLRSTWPQGVIIFCPQVSSGVRGQTAPGSGAGRSANR